jgi:hypothetical protein
MFHHFWCPVPACINISGGAQKKISSCFSLSPLFFWVLQGQCFIFGAVYPSKSGQVHKHIVKHTFLEGVHDADVSEMMRPPSDVWPVQKVRSGPEDLQMLITGKEAVGILEPEPHVTARHSFSTIFCHDTRMKDLFNATGKGRLRQLNGQQRMRQPANRI